MVGDLYGEGLEGQDAVHPESEDYQALIDRGVTIARFTAATLACFTGQDPEVAALTAGNAARYNALHYLLGSKDLEGVLKEAEKAIELTNEGIQSFGEAGGDLGEVLADTLDVEGLPKVFLEKAGEGIGLAVGLGVNALSLVRGKNVKAGRVSTKKAPKMNLKKGNTVHKNRKEYAGDTHVYSIHRVSDGKAHKVGQSAQGVRKKDGASKRAESQARKLRKETGQDYETVIRKEFKNKKTALDYETKLIKKTRKIKGSEALPGNKNDH